MRAFPELVETGYLRDYFSIIFVKMGVAIAIAQATWDILSHASKPELSTGWLGSFLLFILGGMIFITKSLNDYYGHHGRK